MYVCNLAMYYILCIYGLLSEINSYINKGFNIHVGPTQREHYYAFKGKSYE